MKKWKRISAVVIVTAMLFLIPVPALAENDAGIRSFGNLIHVDEVIGNVEFYSSDLVNMDRAIEQMQQAVSAGREQIVSSLHTRGVPADTGATFSSMPEHITAVEQNVYIGEQKIPAEIIYHYHNHEYNGERTMDIYNNAIFEVPDGCYTKEVYDNEGRLKGYTVGCGHVENQIVAADIVAKE